MSSLWPAQGFNNSTRYNTSAGFSNQRRVRHQRRVQQQRRIKATSQGSTTAQGSNKLRPSRLSDCTQHKTHCARGQQRSGFQHLSACLRMRILLLPQFRAPSLLKRQYTWTSIHRTHIDACNKDGHSIDVAQSRSAAVSVTMRPEAADSMATDSST
jgi:hypothetical protein